MSENFADQVPVVSPGTQPPIPADNGGTMAIVEAQQRTAEIQAAVTVAKHMPRKVVEALNELEQACKRPSLAKKAAYNYSRGGASITGPSIHLLKTIASFWGNMRFGWEEVERKPGKSVVKAWAWDLEKNNYHELTFTVKHWRETRGGGYELKGERDIYELCANMASRRVRACLESVIPSYVIQEAYDLCAQTLVGNSDKPLVDRLRNAVKAFEEFGVTQAQVEDFIGRPADKMLKPDLVQLHQVFETIKAGEQEIDHFFEPEQAPEPAEDKSKQKTKPKGQGKKKKAPEDKEAPPKGPALASTSQWDQITVALKECDAPGHFKRDMADILDALNEGLDEGGLLPATADALIEALTQEPAANVEMVEKAINKHFGG